MLRNIVRAVATHPQFYDWTQTLLGTKQSYRRVATLLNDLPPGCVVLDVGGGTGNYREAVPAGCRYYCLDNDPLKAKQFHKKYSRDLGLTGDGTLLPFAEGVADCILCIAVCHHLSDDQLRRLLEECARALKLDGCLLLLEPVGESKSLVSRLLWYFDRGSFPRSMKTLKHTLESWGHLAYCEMYSIWHTYLLCKVIPVGK